MGLTPTANAHDLAGGDLSHYPIMGTPMSNIGLIAGGNLAQFPQNNMAGGNLSRISETGATFRENENSVGFFSTHLHTWGPSGTPAGALTKFPTILSGGAIEKFSTSVPPKKFAKFPVTKQSRTSRRSQEAS